MKVTNSFLKTVSAFSNFGTGKILFGVADDGAVIGIDNPDQKCLDIENRITDIELEREFNEKKINDSIIIREQDFLVEPEEFKFKRSIYYSKNNCSNNSFYP